MGEDTETDDERNEAEGTGADNEVDGEAERKSADDEADAPSASKSSSAAPAKKKSSSGTLIGIVGFLLALGGGFAVGQFIKRDDAFAEVASGPKLNVRLRGDEPQVGPNDALVTIIEFADYQCPYCQQASPPVMKAVDKYDGKVRIIFKHLPLPFHKAALPAAKAAWAAQQQGAFWPVHEALFESKGNLSELDALIAKHGLDAEKFKVDIGSSAAAESIDDDMKAAAVLGIAGTPAFVVNGHHYRGKRDYSQWKQIIEAELEAAEEVVDGGVPASGLYAHLMTDAVSKQAPQPSAARKGGPDPEARYQVKPEGRAALGPADALVTIVEFSDFQCPYCSRMAPVAHQLVDKHPDVRFVFRNLPLGMHDNARPAALAAVAAGRQGKFWEMHDKLFEEQKSIADAADDDFEDWAEAIGLDLEQFKRDYADPSVAREVDEDVAVAHRFGVRGTPGGFVNGKFVSGANVEAFEAAITSERAKAQALVDGGTARDKVLDVLLADALQRVMVKGS